MKILVDTDIGSDIDDALCLAYLFSQTEAEIVGITTVSGDTAQRARLASVIAEHFGRDVPICAGTGIPLAGDQRQPHVPQAEVLKRWPHTTDIARTDVTEFMRELITAAPGDVTLLGIGPLTNVGLLIRRYPEIIRKLARLVCMSGRFSNYQGMADVPEWNVLCDVEAARVTYEAATRVDTLLVSSDVTRRLVLPAKTARGVLNHPGLEPIRDMSEIWFATREKMTAHDALAASLLFQPDLCDYKQGAPVLDTATGITSWDPRGGVVATSGVDVKRFFTYFFASLGGHADGLAAP